MGEQNKVVQKNCKIIRDDNIIKNKVKLTGTIDDIELDITGSIQSMKCTREYVDMSRATYHITIVEDNNLDALRTSINHINSRCSTNYEKSYNIKEQKNMTVKIKKQPVEITLEELKQGEEYERVTIYIDEDKKHEFENKYGIHYGFLPVMNFNDAEFDFKEHYSMVDSNSNKKIPYEIIEKIEVVEK